MSTPHVNLEESRNYEERICRKVRGQSVSSEVVITSRSQAIGVARKLWDRLKIREMSSCQWLFLIRNGKLTLRTKTVTALARGRHCLMNSHSCWTASPASHQPHTSLTTLTPASPPSPKLALKTREMSVAIYIYKAVRSSSDCTSRQSPSKQPLTSSSAPFDSTAVATSSNQISMEMLFSKTNVTLSSCTEFPFLSQDSPVPCWHFTTRHRVQPRLFN